MGLPVHSHYSPLCVCASSSACPRYGVLSFFWSSCLSFRSCRRSLRSRRAARTSWRRSRRSCRRSRASCRAAVVCAVLQVLPYLPAVLADVLGVVADVLAVAAQLTAVVAGFLSGVLHPVRVPGPEHHRGAQGQHYEEGDMNAHTLSPVEVAGKNPLFG